ncbi:glycosyltransferase family 32 protein [[Enterobacter] lignolyticus]|uniref:Glycosyltransferase sugar-binding region containing DXD motif n=1 Tax=Enterobacter lignolyticus (strain SCF1) TaxID=701347 RepID=E3G7D5_ENTLS|nr:glycosyltransferase [[Enterobacter] lignolyticus]ADO48557.1 glycosyltransferase sugar-binding region containing DXD motif [[Enterobacter] lignolyticus SCF1]
MRAIPKKIHQIYTKGWDILPGDVKTQIDRLKWINPDYAYAFYAEPDMYQYIKKHYGQDMLDVYQQINPEYGAARADLFRYLVIYQEGGVYLDIKSSCEKPLDAVIPPDCELILCHWDNGPGGLDKQKGLHPELSFMAHGEYEQWNIMAKKGSPFIKAVIDEVVYRIKNYKPWRYGVGMKGVLMTTGPIVYTEVIGKMADHGNVLHVLNHREIGLVYSAVNKSIWKCIGKSAYARYKTPVVRLGKKDYKLYQLWLMFIFPCKRLKKNIHNECRNFIRKIKSGI